MPFHRCPYCNEDTEFDNKEKFESHLHQKHDKTYDEMLKDTSNE